jgi:hypothetical protein
MLKQKLEIMACDDFGLTLFGFDVFVWVSFKLLFAYPCTEIVGVTLVLRLPLSSLLVDLHIADKISGHLYRLWWKAKLDINLLFGLG